MRRFNGNNPHWSSTTMYVNQTPWLSKPVSHASQFFLIISSTLMIVVIPTTQSKLILLHGEDLPVFLRCVVVGFQCLLPLR